MIGDSAGEAAVVLEGIKLGSFFCWDVSGSAGTDESEAVAVDD